MAWTERTELLLGSEGLARLAGSTLAVVGCGGVGAFAAEMLARAGAGHLILLDSDAVGDTNRNRQLLALTSTVGRSKVAVLSERLLDINPELRIDRIEAFLDEDSVAALLDPYKIDFLVDAIDTLSPKICLIQYCLAKGIPMVSSMGAGAKCDATKVRLTDISKSCYCPLAYMVRKRLHRLGIREGFLAVYSEELPHDESMRIEESRNKKSQVGTVSYMPAVFGCVCAQAAIRHITGI